jgi:hypothetical protein
MAKPRKAPRYRFEGEATLHGAGGGAGTKVTLRNISATGCEIEHTGITNLGKKCELYLEWRDNLIGLQAEIVWRNAQGRMGLKFVSVDKETQRRLQELCRALSLETAARARTPRKTDTAHSFPHFAAPPSAPAPESPRPRPPAEASGRREVPRYVSELPARVSNPATGEIAHATLISLSISGGCLEGQKLPDAGQRCELKAEWEGRPLVIHSDVVWKGRQQVGVRFAPLDDATKQLLKQICANLRLEPRPHIFYN